MRITVIAMIFIPMLSACSLFGVSNVEEANYELLISEGDYELRLYSPVVVAETVVDAEFEEAGKLAFRKLFDYISGNNKSSTDIAMTAPVIASTSTLDNGETVNMTAPVINERTDSGWRYMFVLPSNITIETAPVPLDDNVKLNTLPQQRVAALRFSGFWDEQLNNDKTLQLKKWMNENDMTASSNPRWAGYNPPWTLPFLRRNEILIDIH